MKEERNDALEKEGIRFAESLDDYDHVSVADMGGQDHNRWLRSGTTVSKRS